MDLDQKIARKISQIRNDLGMTQEELAEYSELDVSSFAKIERGERSNIKVNTLEKILKGLNLLPSEFFSEIEDERSRTHFSRKLELEFEKLNDEQKKIYFDIFQKILRAHHK
ncbi:helix-turn-helix domain-containing protein [Streptococcus dentasini]